MKLIRLAIAGFAVLCLAGFASHAAAACTTATAPNTAGVTANAEYEQMTNICNGLSGVTMVDVHGTAADFTLPQPISRTALLGAVLSSYALTTGGTAQTVAALNNARQKFFIANSDTTNTGEDLYVNCLGTNPVVGSTSAGTIDLPPRAVFDPDVPPTQACAVIAATTGHTWEGYTQ